MNDRSNKQRQNAFAMGASAKRIALLVDCCAFAFWATLASVAMLGALPEDALGSSTYSREIIRTLLPEGWAFFTRNPRESTYHIYEEEAGGQLTPADAADARANGFWGIDRKSRLRSIAVAQMASRIPKDTWKECRSTLRQCRREQDVESEIALSMNVPTICGHIVIEEREPVPWAWRRSYSRVHMPSRIARVHVPCES
jgi:antimicrobial peptide system SdpA family protein